MVKQQNFLAADKTKATAQMKFELSKEETTIIKEIIKQHKKEGCSLFANPGTIGGQWSYEFTPTSLGDVKVIKCSCGFTKDYTDYNLW